MLLRTALLLLALLSYASPALAAWGENWGEMVWGAAAPSAVPMMDGLGLGLLGLALIGLAIRGLRSRAALGLIILASFVGVADLVEAQAVVFPNPFGVTIPHEFSNGEVAEAAEVNANFSALADALNVTVPNSFANSGIADANEVNANFTALKTAVDFFTTDLTAATSATATAAQNGCIAGGGTWDASTSTCTAASSYNCFVAGFCAQAAIDFPPALSGYTNVYAVDTQTTEPALSAGCSVFPGFGLWNDGSDLLFFFPLIGSLDAFDACASD
jgi:hypothetical protein